jgi:hypothetical protein
MHKLKPVNAIMAIIKGGFSQQTVGTGFEALFKVKCCTHCIETKYQIAHGFMVG